MAGDVGDVLEESKQVQSLETARLGPRLPCVDSVIIIAVITPSDVITASQHHEGVGLDQAFCQFGEVQHGHSNGSTQMDRSAIGTRLRWLFDYTRKIRPSSPTAVGRVGH
ncbi:hypothetical protein [Candidatus Blastococcus massiliensis]|uniref:hypothetical protein n=1 Tax=Candidatus Blastococcus massiliensis TaxID=1470358 RepID=UPI0005911F91|nr:hypothetical protein [Candidatus Blastococcus massiliensis]